MKKIRIDYNKCTGCRQCEMACSLRHEKNTVNPKKSRIRVFLDDENFYPIIAGPVTDQACKALNIVSMDGAEYDQCNLCRSSCPTRPWFRDPDTNEALTCDMCGECVKWCYSECLSLVNA